MFIARIALEIQASQRDAFRVFATTEGLVPRALPGCITYAFSEDLEDRSRVLLYEEWATRVAFESYKASATFAEIGSRLRGMLAAPPANAYYESDDLFAACAVGG